MLWNAPPLLAFAVAPLFAQYSTPPPGSPAELLATTTPAHLAWGAYLAGETRRPDLIPLIIPLIRHPHTDVQLAAIDALIRLDADLPPEALRGLRIDGDLDPVLVLLARNPRKYVEILMDFRRGEYDHLAWIAVHSILFAAPPPGYAASLLHGWKLELTIEIKDADLGIGCGGRGVIRAPKHRHRTGFPPNWHYVLSESPGSAESTLLAEGPLPVYWTRHLGSRSYDSATDLEWCRKRYLTELSHTYFPATFVSMMWSSDTQYRAAAQEFLDSLRQALFRMKWSLLDQGLLAPSEFNSAPTIDLKIEDRRRNRSTPLPPIAW